ncbi:SDR family NAD(P)-dependent oxidoreductase [Mycolicibacterium sp. 22603]|uniref:SDR family NAD(P)-dependent oxidoreductase n=1 Tax=Mycolicibacterium sp. 22603 TaxID=3453950 RepID=UPI003F85DF6B
MNRLAGKIALVTGAAQGIGRCVAEQFAVQGATVYATDLVADRLPSGAHAMTLDVTKPEQWSRVVEEIASQAGTIDVLVNNAGVIAYADIASVTDAEWERVLTVDQTGVMLGMRAVIPGMKRRGGSIINLSSAWGVVGGSGVAAYQAAKGAVRSMTRNAAITYATHNIRVNSVIPGWVRTPLAEAQDPAINQDVISSTPLGRGAEPVEIAHGCVFLASDEASYVTGSDLVIDGGMLAR